MKKNRKSPCGSGAGRSGARRPRGDAAADGGGVPACFEREHRHGTDSDARFRVFGIWLPVRFVSCGAQGAAQQIGLGHCGRAAPFACLLILSSLWLGEPVEPQRVAIDLGVSAAAGTSGGMLGASMKRKKRKS